MTVCQLYSRQNSHRKNVKRSTEKGREYLMSVLKEDPLGSRSIDSVKLSDAKEWAIRMSEKGYAYKTISNWKDVYKRQGSDPVLHRSEVRPFEPGCHRYPGRPWLHD